MLADITRMAVRQSITAPIAGLLQGAFAGEGLLGGGFGLFHERGVVGVHPSGARHADPGLFDRAPRYHRGGFAGSGLLPDEVPIIARRGELVVPPERVVREEKSQLWCMTPTPSGRPATRRGTRSRPASPRSGSRATSTGPSAAAAISISGCKNCGLFFGAAKESAKHIDGIVAIIMAIGRAMVAKEQVPATPMPP